MKSKTFFTADTHFSSSRTLEFSRRPFDSVDEMDSTIIKNWNELVKKDDIVYHLGDFGNFEIIKNLNGKIILLYGNYERDSKTNEIKDYEKYFHGIYSSKDNLIISNPDIDFKLCLCHEPSNMTSDYFNLFGHVHQLSLVKKHYYSITNSTCMGLNVGIDCHFFKPIGFDVIKFYKNAVENHYDKDVFL